MDILLTNDDGICAPGLAAAAKALSEQGTVWVAAPASDQSGQSHHRHLSGPLRAERVEFPGAAGAWRIHGTPADCVALAVTTLINAPVGLVFSGINHGPNLSSNLLYSGTAAAALEASLAGIPAVAASCAAWDEASLRQAAQPACRAALAAARAGQTLALNLNFPAAGRYRGVRVCRADGVCRHPAPFERAGETLFFPPRSPGVWQPAGRDALALAQRYVTVTPLSAEWSDLSRLQMTAAVLEKAFGEEQHIFTGEEDT